jgi:hypothetical protein
LTAGPEIVGQEQACVELAAGADEQDAIGARADFDLGQDATQIGERGLGQPRSVADIVAAR